VESHERASRLADPRATAAEIVEDVQTALEQFAKIGADLEARASGSESGRGGSEGKFRNGCSETAPRNRLSPIVAVDIEHARRIWFGLFICPRGLR